MIVTFFVGLVSTIAGLAKLIYSLTKAQIQKQDQRISTQDEVIKSLQDDVARVSRGCGATVTASQNQLAPRVYLGATGKVRIGRFGVQRKTF